MQEIRDTGSIPGWGRFPWRREWQPIPVFLPGEFHGQSCVVGYSPWGCKESDMTDQLTFSLSLLYIKYFNNEDLLYSTGNSTQYLEIACNGKEYEKGYVYLNIYICITESVFCTLETKNIVNQLFCNL